MTPREGFRACTITVELLYVDKAVDVNLKHIHYECYAIFHL